MKRFAKIRAKFDDRFKKSLEDLDKSIQSITQVPEQIHEDCKTFTDALKCGANKTATNATPNLKVILKETLNKIKMKQKTLEDQKRNMIIFNAAEQTGKLSEERKASDINLFNSIFKTVCDQECEGKVIRAPQLGRIPEGDC